MIAIVFGIILALIQLISYIIRSTFHTTAWNRKWVAPLFIVVGILDMFTQIKISIFVVVVVFIALTINTIYNILN